MLLVRYYRETSSKWYIKIRQRHVDIIITKYHGCYKIAWEESSVSSERIKVLRICVGIFRRCLITWDLIISSGPIIVNDLFVRSPRVRCHRVRLFACSKSAAISSRWTRLCVHCLPLINDPSLRARCASWKSSGTRCSSGACPGERTCQGTCLSLTAASSSDDLGGGHASKWRSMLNSFYSTDQRTQTRFRTYKSFSRPCLIEFLIYLAARSILTYRQISIGSMLKKGT